MMKNAYKDLEDSAADSIIVTLIFPTKKDQKYVPRNQKEYQTAYTASAVMDSIVSYSISSQSMSFPWPKGDPST